MSAIIQKTKKERKHNKKRKKERKDEKEQVILSYLPLWIWSGQN